MKPALALAILAAAGAAAAQPTPRSPPERQVLIDLAYALGEAHALRTTCLGLEDQAWRGRMNRVIEVERPDEAFRRRLIDGFNAGFVNGQAKSPTCDDDAAEGERAAAGRGRDLARRLAAGLR